MNYEWLELWMLCQDWRGADVACLCVDLDNWPENEDVDPLPPFPLIGVGNGQHPQAERMDVMADAPVPLAALTRAIAANPQSSAVLVQLLRSITAMPLDAALTCESLALATLQGGNEHREWLGRRKPEALLLPPSSPSDHVRLHRQGDRLEITLDRQHAHNAIDRNMRDALFDAFTLAAMDRSISRVMLRGAGRCFSMGADLAEFGTVDNPLEAHTIRMRTLPARALIQRSALYEAHVQGGCVGAGLELAAFATRLTASANAWFQLPEISMGILPGAGGCVSLPRKIGRQRAAALILSGKRIGARTALDWGLVDAIIDDAPADNG